MSEYLDSLIELEFSVIRDYISDKDRKVLSELELYRKVLIYNIYNRALKIFKESERNLEISGSDDGIEGLRVYANIGENSVKLFDFDYRNREIRKPGDEIKIPNTLELSIFQSLDDEEVRKEEVNRILRDLQYLYEEDNPYRFQASPAKFGGPDSRWAIAHSDKIHDYETKFKELEGKVLSEEEKLEVEITNEFYDLMLDDYGLDGRSFRNLKHPSSYGRTKLEKTLVKRMPGVNINREIKYL